MVRRSVTRDCVDFPYSAKLQPSRRAISMDPSYIPVARRSEYIGAQALSSTYRQFPDCRPLIPNGLYSKKQEASG